ncbi:hypothetical protein CBR_g31872 [Chara braunii]|uniref:DUF659 domain-containing protein n=1 Tax=Chara braunii TaxID=69332 RepID=A0A388LFW6_CHABU|nr:hypothetical protein CBR_g31872 [Chara braunii]|eukprot:GBG81199.1 hypothetical protein CBR_g31872 [Chara braunii]
MTKSRCEPVKEHFTEVGDSGRANKGNKQRISNYCDKPVAKTVSMARDHFLKGSRCDVERLRGVVPREKYSRRVKGRLAARSELGVITGETAEGRVVEGRQRAADRGSRSLRRGSVMRLPSRASAYYGILKRAIEEIGVEAVVGVVMDNAAVCAAAGRMVEADYPHIFSVPCTVHSLDLIFESFAKITWVGKVIKRASEVAKFFTNLSRVRDLLIHYSNGGVMAKPGATRFAMNFIMLSSLQGLYLPLRACVTDDDWKPSIVHTSQHELFVRVTHSIFNNTFWADIEKVMQTSKHLLKLLKLVDGTGPTINKVYARMDSAVEKLRESTHFTKAEMDELEVIIMRRWNTMTSPLHCAALFLDPEYRASRQETHEVTVQHRRLRSDLFELERELNESWRKATKASKFLARQHLHDLDQATRTMTLGHANKYKAARAAACAPPSIPAKRGRGRPRKDAAETGDEEVEDVEGGHLERGPAPARETRKWGRPRKAAVEEEAGTRRGTWKRERLQMQPVEEEEEAVLEKTSSAGKHGSNDGSSSRDESGAEHDENDGSGRSGGACDGSGSSDESEGGRGSSDGSEKHGRSSEEEDDSECEGRKEDGSSSEAKDGSELQHSQTSR